MSSAEFQLLGSVGHAFDAGTTLAINTLTQCAATATQVDFFRFNAAKSQAYEIELLAQQIDSRLIGQLVLYDPSGRKIALQRGADDTDPTIEFVAESDGEYGLAIHDFTYRGGGEYFYQAIVRTGDNVAPLIPNLPMARRYVSARAMTVDRKRSHDTRPADFCNRRCTAGDCDPDGMRPLVSQMSIKIRSSSFLQRKIRYWRSRSSRIASVNQPMRD